ncbi:hypothetical protein ONS95_012718 [Cadophora gregata]|uniref:uncharacterized protein n=1 Tax=Cadophora gregata TaxID=51156 RepID=UPI0026DD4428|nr:uncharacterized protein ONS95_012718 [Cadophora gregata]KAK0118432.1 hypothetical protein ONS95_012718 [Cadophora gregata]KAK0123499.1 hypothetical protein ONS96_010482 [Cadophora gregata f. sp. sojae]
MRGPTPLCISALLHIAIAAVNRTEVEARLPKCSVNCFHVALSTNPDLINSPMRSCPNVTLQKPLSDCLQLACGFEEQKQFSLVTNDICKGQPIPSRGLGALVIAITLGPLTLSCVAARFYSKRRFSQPLGMEDYFILGAASLYSGTIPLYIVNTILGFGKHYWNIDPLKIRVLLVIFYIGELSYLTTMPLIKLSILFFYLKLFQSPGFQTATWFMIVFVASAGIAFVVTGMVQCLPISGSFDRSIHATCLDLNAVAYANSAIGIFQDVLILLLPFPEILFLNMPRRKKILLIFMFLLGTLAVLTSILRLPSLHAFATSTDQTWDNQTGSLWSLAEQSVAMICACMPAIRRLLASHLPNIFNLDGFSRDANNDARRSPRKPPSLFRLTSLFSSQGTTITAGSQAQDSDNLWILASETGRGIPLEDLGSPFRCSFNGLGLPGKPAPSSVGR